MYHKIIYNQKIAYILQTTFDYISLNLVDYPASNFTSPGRTVCVLSGRWDIPSVRPESVRGTSKCRAQGCPTVDSQWTSPKDIVGKENFGD
jgi:hypothetical protein